MTEQMLIQHALESFVGLLKYIAGTLSSEFEIL